MFSFQKLLFLVGVIAAVWYGFRMLGRLQAVRREAALREEAATPPRSRRRDTARRQPSRIAAEDLVQCGTCGAYVTRSGNNGCARGDCPYKDV